MKTYLDVKRSVIKQIKAHFENQKIKIEVCGSAGSFDESEIRRLFLRTPSIHVALTAISDSAQADESFVSFVCYLVVQANQTDRLYDNAILLSGSLVSAIKNLEFGSFGYEAKDIKADCLYSGSTDKINSCLWAVNFKAKMRATSLDGSITDELDLENFEGYDATHNIGDEKANDEVNI